MATGEEAMNKTSSAQDRPDLIGQHAFAVLKSRLSSARGLRDALVGLARTLAEKKKHRGYLLLVDPGLSRQFLEQEIEGFKETLRPEIATRLHWVTAQGGKPEVGGGRLAPADLDLLQAGLKGSEKATDLLPPPKKRDEVFLAILRQWIAGEGPMTIRWLQDLVGCNYRTVAATVDRLGHAVQRHSDRSVALKYFPEQEWERFLPVAYKTRATIHYADASDQPRSPESLLQRVRALNRMDIAPGGVIGAKQYYPDLDIIGMPRLDLCIHCPARTPDLDFVQKLDPALEVTRDPHRPARLALHFIRRALPLYGGLQHTSRWADPVECLLHLYDARLTQQARSFEEYLIQRGKDVNDQA